MKNACIFVLCFVCVTAVSGGGHGERRFKELLKGGRVKASLNHVSGDETGEYYSPVYVGNQDGLRKADKISSLPGQPQVNFSQYSGYVTVDPKAGRALFYYFTESEHASDKPLVLWLNGGPGCSSLGAGAMTELGPFRVNPDGKTLWHNKNAWNNVANVIFLESPAGVGFSYSNRSSDYETGDQKTAADAYTFLVNWLERFPEYKKRDFFITGESYAGHYAPQLAALILKNNRRSRTGTNDDHTIINLKGIAIGNAYIDDGDNSRGTYEFYRTHALISDEIHQSIFKNCNFSSSVVSKKCHHYMTKADNAIGNIFAYNIYAPLCRSSQHHDDHTLLRHTISTSSYDPCSDKYVYEYLNTRAVQRALHANLTGIIHRPWDSCSGDTDSVVPVTATWYSLAKINAPVKTPWYPWYTQGEVGGYAVEYEKITFVSVRGAGHFVPSYQPHRALIFFSSFIKGKLPPRGPRSETTT
ncbi:serine carboxypeptidase-like 40 [Perilla frutescens var. hirtella]|nr:serine carboxypeptidase-like 40 [Perilla frutescens var. frutescens]KAH6794067.1 serine carboxypeptidase-like 40 [Perilla frutescens var. hirtella]